MEARDRSLETWFNRVRTGQLRLPRFQRFEAWHYDNVAALIDAVLNELPIGSTLVLEVGEREPFIARPIAGAPEPMERCIEHLLDGQQRLTALWKSLQDLYDDQTFLVYFAQPRVSDDGLVPSRVMRYKRWSKVSDNRRYPLWIDDPVELYKRGLAPVSLLQPADVSKRRQEWCDAATVNDEGPNLRESRTLEGVLRDLQDKVRRFNLPMLTLDVGTKPETALDVFVKMNTSSVPLSVYDIVVAQFEARTGKSLHDHMAALTETVPTVESYVSPDQLVLQSAALRSDRPPALSSFDRRDIEDLDSAWDEVVAGIAWAVEALENEGIFDERRLPTTTILPVLAALHKYIPKELDNYGNARAHIRAYLWRSFVTSRYENASATRALQDFRILRELVAGQATRVTVPIFSERDYPLPDIQELLGAGWPKRKDTLARAILAVSLKAGALDIADGTRADRTNVKGREYHHLFPDSLLMGDGGLAETDSSSALNCVLITMRTNRHVAAKDPVVYLRDRIDRAHLGETTIRDRLRSHVVPFDELNVGGYAEIPSEEQRRARISSDFATFCKARAALVISAFQQLCAGYDWPNESGVP